MPLFYVEGSFTIFFIYEELIDVGVVVSAQGAATALREGICDYISMFEAFMDVVVSDQGSDTVLKDQSFSF